MLTLAPRVVQTPHFGKLELILQRVDEFPGVGCGPIIDHRFRAMHEDKEVGGLMFSSLKFPNVSTVDPTNSIYVDLQEGKRTPVHRVFSLWVLQTYLNQGIERSLILFANDFLFTHTGQYLHSETTSYDYAKRAWQSLALEGKAERYLHRRRYGQTVLPPELCWKMTAAEPLLELQNP